MSMMMTLKEEDIDAPEKRGKFTIAVMGCGRMGLSTACLFAETGLKVIGADANPIVIDLLRRGRAPFIEPGLKALIKKHTEGGSLTVTNNAKEAASASDVIVFVIPTLVDPRKKPDYSHVERACKEVGMGLHSGSLVIFESTVGPGVTETLVKETLENVSGLKAGIDFGLAYSPIRASSGQVLQDIATYPRVVAAINEQSLRAACLILSTIIKAEMIKVRDIKTAEAIKLFENAYRDVNIALANELALFCENVRIDFIEVQKAANTQPYCHLLVPGIVSGHIPTSSHLLIEEAENVNSKPRIVTLARKINDEMLNHALHLTRDALRHCGKTMRRGKISVLGVSNRPNVKEARGSSIRELVNKLGKKGATVRVYDPLFSHKELVELGYPAERTLIKTVEGVDCLFIAVGHSQFRRLNLRRIKFLMKKPAAIVDMGHVIDPVKAEKEGLVYRGVGRGV